MVSFKRDLIAEKNRREKIKSSIIKSWNVNYVDPEEEKRKEAEEILTRFEKEKEDDDVQRQMLITQAYKGAEALYNATTCSYSGMYGMNEMDNVTQDQVQMIFNEKNTALQNIINSGGNV